MPGTRDRVLAWAGLILLLVLHLNVWHPRGGEFYFGWMPEELAFRVLWMALAWVYLVFFTLRVWREDD